MGSVWHHTKQAYDYEGRSLFKETHLSKLR